LKLDNFLCAPHMAGVTQEAVERMAIVTVQNMLSVLDGKPNRENVVNKEVLG
jgi:D-3-phosphoglycerate dehydrogenase